MQNQLRHDVLRLLFSAEPVAPDELDEPAETELTRAARQSVDNADKIVDADAFEEEDFNPSAPTSATKQHTSKSKKQKQRKAERHNRKKGKRKKK